LFLRDELTPVRPIVLASTSRYRRELLGRFGLPFEVEAPGIDEAPRLSEPPAARALRLAVEKARAVAARHADAVVVGSDQVAACDGAVLDKPGDAPTARAQLERLSGNAADFFTACALVSRAGLIETSHVDRTRVHFRKLRAKEIARYVERERPFDCASGFKVESLGIALFDRIECEDPTALIGLPLIWLAGALRAAGYCVP
jgi:septum formation protein